MTAPDDRWSGPSGVTLWGEVIGRLVAGRPLTDLGLGEVDGRVDLRGMPAPRSTETGSVRVRTDDLHTPAIFERRSIAVELSGVTLSGLDLTGARLEHMLFNHCRLQDCRLAGAEMAGASMRAATFVDCDFSRAHLTGVRFRRCTLTRCRFEGPLHDVRLSSRDPDGDGDEPAVPGQLIDVDMSRVLLWHTTVANANFDRVLLPPDADLVVIPEAATAARAAAAISPFDRTDGVQPVRYALTREHDWLSRHGGAKLIDLRERYFDRPAAAALRQAGLAVPESAGAGLVGRPAPYLQALGLTVHNVLRLRDEMHIAADIERHALAGDYPPLSREMIERSVEWRYTEIAALDYAAETLRAVG